MDILGSVMLDLLRYTFLNLSYPQVRGLAPFAAELDFFVEEYAASQGRIPPRKRRGKQTMYIATIEKVCAD